MSYTLPYLRKILREIAPPETDDLVILAKGLGLRKLVCTLLKIYDGPKNLVILVNAAPDEEAGIGELLGTMGVRRPGMRIVDFALGAKERRDLYMAGGLISVTSRILVVDMLTGNIPTKMITGMLVLHAERVNQTSLEAFIVRLYREANHEGFLKAFSDAPEHFNSTMTPLQTCMKMLSLRRVSLWPRFHADVHTSLGQRKADVIELFQPLTRPMEEIQTAIIECMETTLTELRKSCTGVELDEMTLDNALFRNFDRIVRGQLDPIWHRVSPKTRRLVSDLTTLRKLLTYLLSYDSVTFHSYLEAILSTNAPSSGTGALQNQSPWLFLEAANTLFHVAKRRAYIPPPPEKKVDVDTATAGGRRDSSATAGDEDDEAEAALRDVERMEREAAITTGEQDSLGRKPDQRWPPGVEPVLEELPKWGLLGRVLEEIEEEISLQKQVDLTSPGTNTILVMTSSDRTCSQLREYLSSRDPTFTASGAPSAHAGQHMMERLLRTYFWWKGGLGDMARNLRGSKSQPMTRNPSAAKKPAASVRGAEANGRRQPSYKRRRVRGGSVAASVAASVEGGRKAVDEVTGEEKNVGAGLEDEAESIADFLQSSSQQISLLDEADPALLSSSDAGSFFREPSMAHSTIQHSRASPVRQPSPAHDFLPSESATSMTARPDSETPSLVERDPSASADSPSPTFRDVFSSTAASIAPAEAPATHLRPSAQNSLTDHFDLSFIETSFGLLEPESTVVVRPYKGDDDDQVLEELRPRYIIMYDPDQGFIRRIEVYRSSNPGLGVRVYFMMYANSVEEQRYLSGLRKEKDAFQRLIREKGSMLLPITGDPRGGGSVEAGKATLAKAISTRLAGGAAPADAEPSTVIVDMREFRSTLPSLVHAAKVRIIPATLQVGDYILSPEMCVERKSIPDLLQSLASGRLYTQCEIMSVHYKQPILLIEFEQNKSFSLNSIIDIKKPFHAGPNIDPKTREAQNAIISDSDIQSKLVLLTLTFPRLRIIWSSSPFATADIFVDLKLNRAEPSAERAILVGAVEDEDGEGGNGGGNVNAQELLRCIPGVSGKNYRHIMHRVESIKSLCELPLTELQDIMGNEPGKLAHDFLHKSVTGKAA